MYCNLPQYVPLTEGFGVILICDSYPDGSHTADINLDCHRREGPRQADLAGTSFACINAEFGQCAKCECATGVREARAATDDDLVRSALRLDGAQIGEFWAIVEAKTGKGGEALKTKK